MLTLQDAFDRITLACNSDEDAIAAPSRLRLVNESGRFFYGMRSWEFAKRLVGTASIVQGVDYAYPPDGTAEILGVARAGSLPHRVEWTTAESVAEMRAVDLTDGDSPYYAYQAWVPDSNGQPALVIGFWPTPQFSSPQGLNVAYRAGWIEQLNDTSNSAALPIPVPYEALFLRIVQAFAEGTLKSEQGSIEARLDEVANGALFKQAARADSATVSSIGAMRNGALQSASNMGSGSRWGIGALTTPVSDPS